MGRKSRKGAVEEVRPACYYCTRTFDTEDNLISHQKLTHFKCETCGKRFGNAPALGVHMKILHNQEIKSVPKAEFGRDDPQYHIVGSQGVPSHELAMLAAEEKRLKLSLESSTIQTSLSTKIITQQSAEALTSGMVYSDESVSPEEKRAMLPKYKTDEATLATRLTGLSASIEDRIRMAMARRQQVM